MNSKVHASGPEQRTAHRVTTSCPDGDEVGHRSEGDEGGSRRGLANDWIANMVDAE